MEGDIQSRLVTLRKLFDEANLKVVSSLDNANTSKYYYEIISKLIADNLMTSRQYATSVGELNNLINKINHEIQCIETELKEA